MKAPPLETMTTSAPVILAAAGDSNAEPHKWPSMLAVKPRLSATVAAKARNLLNSKSIKVRSFVHYLPPHNSEHSTTLPRSLLSMQTPKSANHHFAASPTSQYPNRHK